MKISIQVLKLILGIFFVSYSGANAASEIVKDARRYLNQLQAKAQDKALFAVLDRNSSEYKNSLLNSQYIAGNQDIYNRAKLTDSALSSSEWLLSKGIQENQNYHKQAGKETVLSAYESTLAAINKRRMSATWLKQQTENDQAQSQASRDEKAANQLNNTIAANYPNARGLFSQSEFLSPDNAYGKAATRAIAEGYCVVGLGKTAKTHLNSKIKSTNELSGTVLANINVSSEAKSDVANLGRSNPNFNSELNSYVSKKLDLAKPILKKDGYYHANGMIISESYYEKLWANGRKLHLFKLEKYLTVIQLFSLIIEERKIFIDMRQTD